MTLRQGLLKALGRARLSLGERAAGQVASFILSCQQTDGGFTGRDGKSDLYYTLFACEALCGLGVEGPAPTASYVLSRQPCGLDLVHLASLARCHLAASVEPSPLRRSEMLTALAQFASRAGDAYACFLVVGAMQDLGASINAGEASRLGAIAADVSEQQPTPVIAAGVTTCLTLGQRPPAQAGDWLLRRLDVSGGFVALPSAPGPDLLSTAVALHAMDALGVRPADQESLRQKGLDFLASLWDSRGGFRGHWLDDHLDCEYAFYGLLAAGHLASGPAQALEPEARP